MRIAVGLDPQTPAILFCAAVSLRRQKQTQMAKMDWWLHQKARIPKTLPFGIEALHASGEAFEVDE
ncbi:hypothetical protein FHS92_003154 [Sphingobium subterraneum]|uniref:Uncharacterized protein n=1 Tax=Sphingobium subterraneum TaxID=627688 RepID=A0A841J346_9SPHN|nr:hypothetical protein [Sphingobium subterraneum]